MLLLIILHPAFAQNTIEQNKRSKDGADRLGKVHGVAGMRIKEKIQESHRFEAALASDRMPAMWNHPYYLQMYEDIVSPEGGVVVEGGRKARLGANPDTLLDQLRSRADAAKLTDINDAPGLALSSGISTSGATTIDAREIVNPIGSVVSSLVKRLKDDLRGHALPRARDSPDPLRRALDDIVVSPDTLVADASTVVLASDGITTGKHLDHDPRLLEWNDEGSFAAQDNQGIPTSYEWYEAIRALGVRGRVHEAIELAEEIQNDFGVTKDEGLYAALIGAAGDSQRPDLAESLFDELRWQGIVPSLLVWTALLNAQAQCGRLETAFAVMQNMESYGIKPDLYAYTSLLVNISRHSSYDACYEQAKEVLGPITVGTWSKKLRGVVSFFFFPFVAVFYLPVIRPSYYHTKSCSYSFCLMLSLSFPFLGVSSFHLMPPLLLQVWFQLGYSGSEPDLISYTAMVHCCVRSREIEHALSLLEEMRQMDVQPSVVTFNILIHGLTYAPQWHESNALLVDEILDIMQAHEVAADLETFNNLIRSCAAVGDVVNARVYFNELVTRGYSPTGSTYAAMFKALGNAQALTRPTDAKRYLTR